jgi:phosphoglycolate phosphatase
MMKNHIFWDLDGTITDPKEGIIKSIQYALEKFGKSTPPFESLTWCIGPPLYDSFPQLVPGSTKEDVLKLVSFYRERFSGIGLYENRLYREIGETLRQLEQTKKQYLATSKPHIFANRILNHFELSPFFKKIYGSELSGVRSDKAELIAFMLEQENISPDDVYMIGDRKHDIIGAQKNKVTSIGLTWGYGGREELTEAGADFIFETPTALKEFLLKN